MMIPQHRRKLDLQIRKGNLHFKRGGDGASSWFLDL